MYSEQDLKYAAEYRDEIHNAALERVRAVYPRADSVVDRYHAESYFQQVWEYPGQWYTVVGTPQGAGSRIALVEAIVRETLSYCRETGMERSDEPFERLMDEYPDIACEYRIINEDDEAVEEKSVFPYRGAESHRPALSCAARELSVGGGERQFDLERIRCRKLKSKALFAPANSDEWLNYRKAFFGSPRKNAYTDGDFERVNAALFPGGADALEVYRWTWERPECLNEGARRESLLLTVYDSTLFRFVVITAKAEK
ncbi:MAG: hypothetical protein IKZ82_06740 [Clostridia bacterium]|nr:hypothetical protein [Clostridia bacterium]